MAYKRPLSNSQIACIILLWAVLMVFILRRAVLSGPTLVSLFMATILLAYPIIKSIRQRRKK